MTHLARNRIRCKKCHQAMESLRTRHFCACPCGVWVDGGLERGRMGWPSGEKDDWVEDLRVWGDKPESLIIEPQATVVKPGRTRDVLSKFFD